MGLLLSRRLGGFRGTGLWPTLGKVAAASVVMAAAAGGVLAAVESLTLGPGLARQAFSAGAPGVAGVVVYFWVAARLGVGEVRTAATLVRRRLRL
jgi:hypothetical protein